jgi:hypothetical protein
MGVYAYVCVCMRERRRFVYLHAAVHTQTDVHTYPIDERAQYSADDCHWLLFVCVYVCVCVCVWLCDIRKRCECRLAELSLLFFISRFFQSIFYFYVSHTRTHTCIHAHTHTHHHQNEVPVKHRPVR